MTKPLVEPQTLKGCQDLLPEDMISRNAVIGKIQRVYEKFGFSPIDTPALEHLVTLVGTGGAEINKDLFRLESPEREPLALRFDLTVPFARLIAQYPEKLKLPFRRYHIGPVFRADDPAPGRYRQFTQFDIDIAGVHSVVADAEIVATMCESLRAVGLRSAEPASGSLTQEFQVRINNRKLVDALLVGNGIADENTQKHVLRVIDKLQKVGIDSVRDELGQGRVDKSGDPIPGVGLPAKVIGKIVAFISLTGNSRGAIMQSLAEVLPSSEATELALAEMADLSSALVALRVSETDAVFDPSLTRGLDYYTGPVFEASIPNSSLGSFMGGGRYDRLVERFLDTSIPATGASIGVDRLMYTLKQLGKVDPIQTPSQVIVISLPGVPSHEMLVVASELRAADLPTEAYIADGSVSMRDQLSYANSKGVPIAVILGEDEIKTGQVSVKDLRAGKEVRAGIQDREEYRKAGRSAQVTVSRGELLRVVKEMLV